MWIFVREKETSRQLGEGYVENLHWAPERKGKRLMFKPGTIYLLYIYQKSDGTDEMWTPENQEGVLIHEISQTEKPHSDPSPPAKHLFSKKILFQVTNDGVLPHVTRWRFVSQNQHSRFWHLPLHVKVSQRKILLSAFTLGVAPAIGLTYEVLVAWLSGQPSPDPLRWGLSAGVVALVAILLIYGLLNLFFFLWNRDVKD